MRALNNSALFSVEPAPQGRKASPSGFGVSFTIGMDFEPNHAKHYAKPTRKYNCSTVSYMLMKC